MDPSVSITLVNIFASAFLANSGLTIIILALLIASAVVSASEAALFSLSPSHKESLREAKDSLSSRVLEMLEEPDKETGPRRLLASILIANNLINLLIVLLCTQLSDKLFPADQYSDFTIFLINVVAITTLIVLFGEVIPKIYATRSPVQASRIVALPLWVIRYLMKPFALVLMSTTSIIESKLRSRASSNISVDELGHALELTADDNRTREEHKILEGIVTFGAKEVNQIMTPRTAIASVNVTDNFAKVLETIHDKGYSRMPVYGESADEVKGVLYIKDLITHLDDTDFDWTVLIRAPFFVPENKKIDDLLQQFKQEKIHMTIVVDEYGGTSGLVTLEDILEEIVGDIHDEFDTEELSYSKLDDKNYVLEGKVNLVDMYKILDIDEHRFEDARGDSSTLAGFIIEQAGRIPAPGETISFDGFVFRIESADKRKIKRIKVTIP
ncbi:MAG: hypothetical protein RL220_571 [Bacteroidota bacterium]